MGNVRIYSRKILQVKFSRSSTHAHTHILYVYFCIFSNFQRASMDFKIINLSMITCLFVFSGNIKCTLSYGIENCMT